MTKYEIDITITFDSQGDLLLDRISENPQTRDGFQNIFGVDEIVEEVAEDEYTLPDDVAKITNVELDVEKSTKTVREYLWEIIALEKQSRQLEEATKNLMKVLLKNLKRLRNHKKSGN